jgi:hypothetical protein
MKWSRLRERTLGAGQMQDKPSSGLLTHQQAHAYWYLRGIVMRKMLT